ncbi:MAG: glycerate kinase, partial [Cyanobacteriota bacterium]|nr:glycerate kinase [Cyanobacteriota bacterium]
LEPIITESDRQFARDINQKLQDYVPLWNCLDRLMVLNPVDYRLSKQWRKQAEHEMIATGKSGMTDTEIEQFVDYFWKSLHPELFITPLVQNPQLADLVVDINADHSIGQIYPPGL